MTNPNGVETELRMKLRSGPVEIRIVTGSMEPLLQVGHVYRLHDRPRRNWARFDVVVFWSGEVLVAHYVWHVNAIFEAGNVITKSLRPGAEDLPLREDQILGFIPGARIPRWTRFTILSRSIFRNLFS